MRQVNVFGENDKCEETFGVVRRAEVKISLHHDFCCQPSRLWSGFPRLKGIWCNISPSNMTLLDIQHDSDFQA